MRRRLTAFLLAVVGAAGAYASTLLATPASNFSTAQIIKATFDEVDLNADALPQTFWRARVKTKGLTDLYVVTNVWKPGGTTGWHTHPGPSFVIVTAGALTAYDGDDPTCTPQVYTVGMGFVDPGEGHPHVVRNEGLTDASTTAVQLIPNLATRRINADAPANCPGIQ